MTATTDTAPVTSRGRALPEVVDDLEAVVAELTDMLADGVDDVEPAVLLQALGALRKVGQRVDAARLAVLPAVQADGRWALDGSRSFAHWVARTQDVTLATARRDVRTATVLHESLPATRDAALRGRVGGDHLRALVDIAPTSAARRDALAAPVPIDERHAADEEPADDALTRTGEEFLLELARAYPVGLFRRMVRRFAYVADPDSDERAYRQASEREFLDISPTWGGYHLAGFLTEEHGQALRAAVEAVMGRPAADDTRTPAQRRAQALADLARIALDSATIGTGAAVRPHVNVTVSWTELTTLVDRIGEGADDDDDATQHGDGGLLDVERIVADGLPRFPDGRGPVPPSLLRRIACDAEVTRIVFGPDSQVLDVGRTRRTVTGQLRRAVIARDGHCTWPGCDEPPSRCEVHHAVTHWADGGETSVENSALLCWHHHDRVDTHGVTMRRHAGAWRFTDRHGRPISMPDAA
jgi:hypothetical protein